LVALSALVAVFVYIYSVPYVVAVLLLPVQLLCAGISTISEQPEQRLARVLATSILVLTGIGLLTFGVVRFTLGWPTDRSPVFQLALSAGA
jgi:hypothetical protein